MREVVREYTPDQLRPYFGVYRAGVSAWIFGAVVLFIIGTIFVGAGFFLATSVGAPRWASMIVAALSGIGAICLSAVQISTITVIGPDEVAVVSRIRRLSWSIPMSDLIACRLLRGHRGAALLQFIAKNDDRTIMMPFGLDLR